MECGGALARSRSFAAELTQPHFNTVLWTPHSSRGCSDSCSRTARVSLYDHVQNCRSGYRAPGGMRRDDASRVQAGGERELGDASRNESHWQQRSDLFPLDMSEEYQKYPMVTADQLRGRRERPRRVKMLTRDFIEGFQSYPSITEQKLRIKHRLLIQPFVWLLLQASGDLHSRGTIRLQQHPGRARIPSTPRTTIHRI